MAMDEEDYAAHPKGSTLLYGFIREGPEVGGNWLCVIESMVAGGPMVLRKRIDKVMSPAFVTSGLLGTELTLAWEALQRWDDCTSEELHTNELADARSMVFDLQTNLAASRNETLRQTNLLKEAEKFSKPLKSQVTALKKQVTKLQNNIVSNEMHSARAITTIRDKHVKEMSKMGTKHDGLISKIDKMATKLARKEEGDYATCCLS
jgi:hypothetical protein